VDIFVGNLSFDSTEADIKTLFEKFGGVSSVVIMMREGKKNPKSRGFGFVQMPDEAQALAAIAALNTTEFMGRALTVAISRPKKEKPVSVDMPAEERDESRPQNEERPWQKKEQEKPWVSRPGKYKGGRRTRSYVGQHGSTGMQKSASPWQRNKNNPMRWRKDKDQSKPWQKSAGESKPWEKGERGSRPWRKSEEGLKPWEKPAGESKPRRKAEDVHKPWRKSGSEVKPWKKRAAGRFKSWGKGDKRARAKTGFNPRKDK